MQHLIDFNQIIREHGIIYFNKHEELKIKFYSDVNKYLDDLNPTQHQFLYAYYLHSKITKIEYRDAIDIFMLKKDQKFFKENQELLIEFEKMYMLDKETEIFVKTNQILKEQKVILKRCISIKTSELIIFKNNLEKRKAVSVDCLSLLESILKDLDAALKTQESENILATLETNFRNFIQKQHLHRDLVC